MWSTKSFSFYTLYKFGISFWRMKCYVICIKRNLTKFCVTKKLICSKKFLKKKILFKFGWYQKICQNRLVPGWDIANLRFQGNVNNLKTRFVLKNYGPNEKYVLSKIVLSFTFTISSKNLIQISSSVTEIQHFWENLYSISHINVFERYGQYKNNVHHKNSFIYRSYNKMQIFFKLIHWVKMFDQHASRVGFHLVPNRTFLPNLIL